MDQPRRLIFKDSLAPMPKDRVLAASNRIMAEWDNRTRELKKQEMRRKQEARDRGEDVSSDDDDDDDDDGDEVASDVDWGVLEDEGTLTSAHPSMQEPLPFRAEGSESARSAEVGAEESASSRGVPAKDRWMGGDGSEAVPEVLVEGGGSDAAPRELMEGAVPAPRPMS